jgi:hypothetical protein
MWENSKIPPEHIPEDPEKELIELTQWVVSGFRGMQDSDSEVEDLTEMLQQVAVLCGTRKCQSKKHKIYQ